MFFEVKQITSLGCRDELDVYPAFNPDNWIESFIAKWNVMFRRLEFPKRFPLQITLRQPRTRAQRINVRKIRTHNKSRRLRRDMPQPAPLLEGLTLQGASYSAGKNYRDS